MRMRFLGAAGEVTGSCYLVETSRARVLVDFGMHQGGPHAEAKNRRFPPIRPQQLDAVVLTHAHLDHCGRLPLLPMNGFSGPIHATPATIDMTEIILRDAAYIQEKDAERASRRRERAGRGKPVPPLYRTRDAEKALRLLKPTPYDTPTEVAPGVTIRLVDAGHILGSASVEMQLRDGENERTIAFSADIGPRGTPLLHDPVQFRHADVLILESTYGDRNHRPLDETIDEFSQIIVDAHSATGKIIIPSFAVGRTQNLIYYLRAMVKEGLIGEPSVYIDSPMAIEATNVYRAHRDLFDAEAREIIGAGDRPLHFPGLHFARTADDSRALNHRTDGIIVISASGMCTGGRIMHHLRHNLFKKNVHVVFVGFQAEGTLGRRLVNRAERVRIMGENIAVKAQIHTLGGFSAHAGQNELVQWASSLQKSGPRVFLTHGENKPRHELRKKLRAELGWEQIELPEWGHVVEL